MVTDDERRKVARELRSNAEDHPDMPLILNVAFATDDAFRKDCREYTLTSAEAALTLANLIDPGSERTCRNVDRSGGFTCSECGVRAHVLVIDEDMCDWTRPPHPDYCPGCGAKVVEDGHR